MKIILTVLLIFANISFSQFTNEFLAYRDSLLNNGSTDNFKNSNYSEVFKLYKSFREFRYNGGKNYEELYNSSKQLDDVLESSEKLYTPSELLFLNGLSSGIKAYSSVGNSTTGIVNNGLDVISYAEEMSEKTNSLDSKFLSSATNFYLSIYYYDSFWVNLFFDIGDFKNSLKTLEKIALDSVVSSVEANEICIEYYADIYKNYAKSIQYSKKLVKKYPSNTYFKFLYARDLFYIGETNSALTIFTDINGKIGDKFYYYHYLSLLYEAECYLLLKNPEKSLKVLEYVKSLHWSDKAEYLYLSANILLNSNFIEDKKKFLKYLSYDINKEIDVVFLVKVLWNYIDYKSVSLKEIYVIKSLHNIEKMLYSDDIYIAERAITALNNEYYMKRELIALKLKLLFHKSEYEKLIELWDKFEDIDDYDEHKEFERLKIYKRISENLTYYRNNP